MRDVYMVNLIIGLGLVLYLVNVKGWLSLFLLIMMIPLIGGYMRILTGLIGGIHINESIKKLIVLLVTVMLGGVILEIGYVTAFMYFFGGVTRTVILGVYVFMIIGVRIWVIVWSYVILGNFIGDNYKLLRIGILPLVVFFVKICGSYILLWIVMVYSMYNLL
ncbi:hypothetical protein CMK18_00290 [Candidatus Poribacteria bacterium]|nr:hypothetical protein [Candidatus Poribacteria bacterium]